MKKSSKKVIVGILGLAVVSLLAFYLFGGPKAPPEVIEGNEEEVKNYLASNEFKNSDKEKKQEYLKKLRDSDLSVRRRGSDEELSEDEQARAEKIRENTREVYREMMMDRAKTYFELPEEERQTYLDKMIDEMQKRRAEWAKKRAERKAAETNGGGETDGDRKGRGNRFGPDRMKERIETGTPEERAVMTEFRKAMRARMAARNITPSRGRR